VEEGDILVLETGEVTVITTILEYEEAKIVASTLPSCYLTMGICVTKISK
jgi:hypothetical protein